MKKDMVRFAAILPALLILLIPASFADARDPGEAAKIEYLIKSVEDLHGVKFIRNGSEYDSKKAADHLRLKLGKAGPRVKTAEDFITLCGSRSYLSGKPYMMRFPDGTAVTAESFFRRKLNEYK